MIHVIQQRFILNLFVFSTAEDGDKAGHAKGADIDYNMYTFNPATSQPVWLFWSQGKVSKFLQILLRQVTILNVPMDREFSKIRIFRNFQTFARLVESRYSIYPWREISQNLADFSEIQLNLFEVSGQVVKAEAKPIASILSSTSLEISQDFWEFERLLRFWEISRLLLDLLSIDTQCTLGALTTDVFLHRVRDKSMCASNTELVTHRVSCVDVTQISNTEFVPHSATEFVTHSTTELVTYWVLCVDVTHTSVRYLLLL